MKKYEITFVISENYTEDKAADIARDIKKQIESHGGKVEKEVFWGKRKLIYKIAKNSFGYYYVFIFDIEPEKTNKLNKELNLSEKILRYLIVDFIEGSPFFEEGAREKEKERVKRDLEESIEKRPARKVFKKRDYEETPVVEVAEVKEVKEENQELGIKNKEEEKKAKEQESIKEEVVEKKVNKEDPVKEEIKEEPKEEKVKEAEKEKEEPVAEEIKEDKKDDGMEERKPERRQMTEEERKDQLEKKLAELLKDEEL